MKIECPECGNSQCGPGHVDYDGLLSGRWWCDVCNEFFLHYESSEPPLNEIMTSVYCKACGLKMDISGINPDDDKVLRLWCARCEHYEIFVTEQQKVNS